MKISTKNLLFSGSFFLPTVKDENIRKATDNIIIINSIPAGIAFDQIVLCEIYRISYFNDPKLNNKYKASKEDFESFFAGFNFPLIIFTDPINSIITHSSSKPLDPQNNPVQIACHKFKDDIKKATSKNFLKLSMSIFDFCQNNPPFLDDFFELGIISSQTTFREYATRIDY